MGPKALRVTGELADGTLPYLAGPRTVAEFIAPTITKAAADAGRPAPRIIAAVAVLVTDDVDAGRAAAAYTLGFYTTIPCIRRSSRENARNPSRTWPQWDRLTWCVRSCSATAMRARQILC
jgi:alkanesulfonate monooxygenase SsuD/methylene tetrahydromethanopterin reductase-like flavin-dependent oxidoreductase (luciferase family)